MELDKITEQFQKMAEKVGNLGKSLKFVVDNQVVFIDMTGETPKISTEDQEADTTIITSLATLEDLKNGGNPMTAVMTGKIKIKGDMGLAMKLSSFFK
jgi:putative sterol carrier protein